MKLKKLSILALTAIIGLSSITYSVHAKETRANELPDNTKFATVDDLKSFNTNEQDGTNPAKVYFGNNNQQWWIAGSQKGNLTLFAASSLATNQKFESSTSDKKYESEWNCQYPDVAPSDVHANHYGASPLRTTLQGLENSYFTSEEQSLMNDTTIYTNDTKNNKNYSTTNKLYLAYGNEMDTYITVGTNSEDSLNNGLRIDMNYWGNSGRFWLRAPHLNLSNYALVAAPGDYVYGSDIAFVRAVVPAFELNLSSVIFASAAPAASDGVLTTNDAFTLRYSTNTLGSAQVSYDKSKVNLSNVPSGTYLVVQNSNGAYAKQITNETEVKASDVDGSLTSFENCKVWLEITDTENRITSATLATELKDGNALIVEPKDLKGVYEQTLSDIQLDNGWKWTDETISLTVGTQRYSAYFDTTTYENDNDFNGVDGYDSATHRVVRDLEVTVDKADSKIEITTPTMDKVYDGKKVSNPKVNKTGSTNDVTFTWYQKQVDGTWQELSGAPTSVGRYKVVASVTKDNNYNGASIEKEFSISIADNEWIEKLSIKNWSYGESANTPNAKAQFGNVTFTYSNQKDGTYTETVPTDAGTYYVKATVTGTENYASLEAVVSFEIKKAVPTYEKVPDLVIKQGQSLSEIELPKQFKWVDDTQTVDTYGMQTFKAIYTPEDTTNYQTIEVDIEVEVLSTPVELNHVPTINASDKTITVGDPFDPLKDVTATDNEDGDITKNIKIIKNTVDTDKAGTYEVTYQVTDTQGATDTKTIKVIVKDKEVKPNTDKPHNEKDKDSVDTGDQANKGLYTSMFIMSALGIAVLMILKKKKVLEHR